MAIVNHGHCDLGTALVLFWLADGIEFLFGGIERSSCNAVWVDFCENLVERLVEEKYPPGPNRFKPNISSVMARKLEIAGISPILLGAVEG